MVRRPFAHFPRRRFAVLAAVILTLIAIGVLVVNITRDVVALNEADENTASWSLSQAEIETLELLYQLRADDPDLVEIRKRYDVLYSRVRIFETARLFAGMRNNPNFTYQLSYLRAYLDATVSLIDSDDPTLLRSLDVLEEETAQARARTRQLSIIGLEVFATTNDQQRADLARSTFQLAAAITLLVGGLGITLALLDRMNRQAIANSKVLNRTAKRLNTIVDTALDGVIVADANGTIVTFNPTAAQIFAISEASATGRNVIDFIQAPAPLDGADAQSETQSITPQHQTQLAHRADGSVFPAEIVIERAALPDGDFYIVTVRDISLQVANEKELVAARDTALRNERSKSEFLATMSHEIRTPLNGLLGSMDLLSGTALSATQQQHLKNMETSGRILMRHVKDVLDVAQYDDGHFAISEETMHLPTLLDDITATQISLAQRNGTTLDWQWQGPPQPWIHADRDRLQHILMNLVGNAVKFTQQGTVHIIVAYTVQGSGHQLRLSVTDTGPGIAPDLIAQVFDDFVTGEAVHHADAGGTGLGLGIARRFAEGLGGTLNVKSSQGVGSTFTLDVPITLASAPVEAEPDSAAEILPRLTVLVVEDNAMNRDVVRGMLEAEGQTVVEAVDGAEGVSVADQTRFDIILMDINMPEMDGQEAATRIKTGEGRSKPTPIVALTANAMARARDDFWRAGLVATLTKPLTRATMRQTLLHVSTPVVLPPLPLIDEAHINETRAALGAARFAIMCDRFQEEIDGFLSWFILSPPPPLAEIAEQAHTVASSAAMFGAKKVREALIMLEDAARAEDGVTVIKLHALLNDIWPETRTALQQIPQSIDAA